MSAFSTVGDVFSDNEFSAPCNSHVWRTVGLDESHKDCTGFLIMPRRLCTWRVQKHGRYKCDNEDLGFAPSDVTAHYPVFLHLRVTNFLGPSRVTRSAQAWNRRLSELQASRNANVFVSALPSSLPQVPFPRSLRLVLPRQEILAFNIQQVPSQRETFPTPIQFHAPSAPCRPVPFWREHPNQHRQFAHAVRLLRSHWRSLRCSSTPTVTSEDRVAP